MLRLLKIEWMKLKAYKAFWVFVTVFAVIYPLILGMSRKLFSSDRNSKELVTKFAQSIMADPFSFPGFWHFSAYCGGLLVALLGLIIIMHTCNEYNYKTHRQNVIDGWSRKQFVLAKLSLIIAIGLGATLYQVIMTFIFGPFVATNTDQMFNPEGLVFIFYFFVECVVYMTFALMIGILLKRAGLAIGLYFIYAYIIDNVFFGFMIKDGTGARFLPLDSADSLINNQLLQKVPIFEVTESLRFSLLIACFVYTTIYIIVSFTRFAKKDL